MERTDRLTETKQFAGKLRRKDLRLVDRQSVAGALMDLLCFLDPQKVKNKRFSSRSEFFRHFLPLFFITCNQLAYLPLKPPYRFSGTGKVLVWILWLRADFVAGQTGQQTAFLFAVWGLIGGLFCLVVFCLISLKSNTVPHPQFNRLFNWVTSLLFFLFPVPVVSLLVADVCSWLGGSPSGLDAGRITHTWAASASCLCLFALLLVARETAGIEVLCHPKFWAYGAKTDIRETFFDLFALIGTAAAHFTTSAGSPYVFYCSYIAIHSLCVLFYYLRLPLYSEVANLVHVSCHLVLVWGGFAMLIGYSLESDSTAVMLVIVVSPAILSALQSSWHSLYASVLGSRFEDRQLKQSRAELLLAVRAAILMNDEETVASTFRILRISSEEEMDAISLLESSYTLQFHGNESLARYQLSRQSHSRKRRLLDSFLKYKMWKRLDRSTDLEEVNFLKFLDGLSKVQEMDELLCRDLADFWGELASQDLKKQKINLLVDRICAEVKHSKRLYSSLIATSPENPILLESYATFLRDILLKPEKAALWETKMRIIKEAQQRSAADSEVNFSDSETGLLLADMSFEGVGQILYFNAQAASLLQYDSGGLATVKLFALIPPPYSNFHTRNLKRFCALRDTTSINHPQLMPLLTAKGFVAEFNVRIAVTSVGGPALILLGFRRVTARRELALLSHEGQIYAHTEGFPALLSLKETVLESRSVYEFCPDLAGHTTVDQTFRLKSDPPVFGALCTVPYQSKFVRKLLLYSSQESCLMFTSLKESHRRNKQVMLRNLSSSDVGKLSSNMASRIPDKTDSGFLPTPHLLALTSRIRETRTRRVDGFIDSFDKKFALGVGSQSSSTLKSNVKIGLNRVFSALASVTSVVILLLIAWNVAITIYLITVTQNLIDSSISIELSERIIHSTRMAGQGRFLDLTNAGFFPEGMTVDVKNVVSQSVAKLTAIEELIWARLENMPDGKFKDMNLENVVKTWEMSGTLVHLHERNLVNAMKVYIEHSKLLLDLSIRDLTVKEPSVFFLMQNGMKGDLIIALSKSLALFKDMEKQNIEQNVSRIMFLVISVFFTLGLALLVSIPVLTRLQLYIMQVSDVFTQLPLARCLESKKRVVDHLKEHCDIELEYGVDKPKRKNNRYSLYTPTWKLVSLVLGFFCSCVVLYVILYLKNIASLVTYVSMLPEVMQYYALRFTGLIDLWTWTMEAIFADSSWPLKLAIPGYSTQLNPAQSIAISAAYLKKVNRKLFEMAQAGYLPFTDAHQFFFLHETNYTTPMLQKGLRVGMVSYVADIRLCAGYRGVSAEMYTDCGALYSAAREFVNISSDVLRIVQEDFQAEVNGRAWKVNYWLFAWTAFGILFLLTAILPLVFKARRHVQRLIAIASLIPGDGVTATDLKKTMSQTAARDTTIVGNKHG